MHDRPDSKYNLQNADDRELRSIATRQLLNSATSNYEINKTVKSEPVRGAGKNNRGEG